MLFQRGAYSGGAFRERATASYKRGKRDTASGGIDARGPTAMLVDEGMANDESDKLDDRREIQSAMRGTGTTNICGAVGALHNQPCSQPILNPYS